MRNYRRFQRACFTFLVLYVTAAFTIEMIPRRYFVRRTGEIYPIATFALFSWVPNIMEDYGVRLRSVEDEPLDPPPFYEKVHDRFRRAGFHDAHQTIQVWGAAFAEGDMKTAEEHRHFFETLYLESRDVVYELTLRRYHPVERWRDGSTREVMVLATYDTTRSETP